MKNYRNFLGLSIYFFLSNIYFQIFLCICNRFLHFHMILAALLFIVSFFFLKLIIFIACSLKNSQTFYAIFTSVHIMIVFHASKWGVTVDIEKSDGISLLTFVVNDEVLGLFLHSSIFSIIHSRSA